MKQIKKTCLIAMATLLIVALIIPTTIITVYASTNSSKNVSIKSNVTVNNEFADDRVIVILTQKASLAFVDYKPEDFSEVDCENVFCVTTAIYSIAKGAIDNIHNYMTKGEELRITPNLDLSDYRNMICLELKNAGKQNVINAIKTLQSRDDVYFACPDYEVTFDMDTNGYSQDDSFRSDYTQPQYIYDLLGISAVWELLESYELSYYSTPRVAVIDSGITHSLLSNYVVDTISADLCEFDNEYDSSIGIPENMMGTPIDDRGHGTMVAGIIASVVEPDFGQTNNISYSVSFSSIKVGGASNETTDILSVIAAINYVNDLQIPIINMSNISVIPPSKVDLSILFQNAIAGYQGLIICAAGNSGAYLEAEWEDDDAADNDLLPAALTADNLITVGACDLNGNRWTLSNWGDYNVELFAPGVSILSCFPELMCSTNECESENGYDNSHVYIDVDNDGQLDNGYHCLSGTSFATPWVTGVAAMILAFNPALSSNMELVKDIIVTTVDEYDSLEGLCISGGRLNAYAAIMEATDYCSHYNFVYTSKGINGHNVICSSCHYISEEGHKLYIYADNGEDGVTVKCNKCSYSRICDEGVAEYGYNNLRGHYVSCTCGCYLFFESHSKIYSRANQYYHIATCTLCGTPMNESHTWVELSASLYRCTLCGQTSSQNVVMGMPPEDEDELTE